MAAAALEADDIEEAVSQASRAKRMASRSPSIREFLGLVLYGQGEYKSALSELRTAARITGSRMQVPVMADCLRALGRPEKSIELLDELDVVVANESVSAEAGRPAHQKGWRIPEDVRVEAALVRAGILLDQDDLAGAVSALRKVLVDPRTVKPHHLRLWYMLADLFERGGKVAEAKRLFGRVAEHNPEFLDAAVRASGAYDKA